MRIHHATAAKAEKAGVTLEADHDENVAVASIGGLEFRHTDPKQALEAAILQSVFTGEYPALALHYEEGIFSVTHTDEEGDQATCYEGETVPTLAAILDFCQDNELDPEIGFEEEPDRVTVVAAHYKQEYKARGNPNHCGDWLASTLVDMLTTKEGFDVEGFTALLTGNGVPLTGKWAALPTSGQAGWQGRYRMNGRQKLEVIVATRGALIDLNGNRIAADRDWLEAMLAKHSSIEPEWLDAEAEA